MSDNGLYTVEEILSKRVVNRRNYYLVKWLGYPSEENTWEPESPNLENCRSLVEKFERKAKQTAKSITLTSGVKKQRREEAHTSNQPTPPPSQPSVSAPSRKVKVDFKAIDEQTIDPALKADRVIGLVIDPDTERRYLVIRWKNSKDRQVDLVSAAYANRHYPQEVIAFYESKIVFT